MNITIKRVVFVISFAIFVCCSIGYAALAAQPRYSYIYCLDAAIWTDNGKVSYAASASASLDCEEITLVATLQRKNSSGKWVSVKTKVDTASDGADANCEDSVTQLPGYDYRLYAECRVYGNGGQLLETAYITKTL